MGGFCECTLEKITAEVKTTHGANGGSWPPVAQNTRAGPNSGGEITELELLSTLYSDVGRVSGPVSRPLRGWMCV